MSVLYRVKTEAQKCEGAHTRHCTAPVAKSLGCRGQTAHRPARASPDLVWDKEKVPPKRSRQIPPHAWTSLLSCFQWPHGRGQWERGNQGQSGVPRMGKEIGREGGKEAAAPPRHLTPAWGRFGPIPCTRARNSFGTGPTCPGKSRAMRRGQSQSLSLW